MKYIVHVPRITIDIAATARKLKSLRIQHGYEIKELQHIFGFTNPVSIYAWENENKKSIPCLENLDLLSRLYGVHVEDLYVTREIDSMQGAPEVWVFHDPDEGQEIFDNVYAFPYDNLYKKKEELPQDSVTYVF